MTETIRAFIAIPVPDAVAEFLEGIQARLRSPRLKVRWLPAGNIHLTLKFLGDIAAFQVADIAAQMDAVAGSMPVFRLQAKGVAVFPGLRKARVLWVGLAGDLELLRSLQATLEAGLQSVGFETDSRRFRAHLTIARIGRRGSLQNIGGSLESLHETASDSFRVDRLSLYQSVLKPSGAEYTLLHTSYLKQTGED